MYTENRYAVAMYGHESNTKSQLNFKKTGDKPQPTAKIQTPPKKKGATSPASQSASKAVECRVCKKKHVELYHECPLLKDIQHKKVKLPQMCCKLCLGRVDAAGKCTRGDNCHIYTSKRGFTYTSSVKLTKIPTTASAPIVLPAQ